MCETVVTDKVFALRAFSRAGAAQDVDYRDVFGGEGGGGFLGGGEEGVLRRSGRWHCWFGCWGGFRRFQVGPQEFRRVLRRTLCSWSAVSEGLRWRGTSPLRRKILCLRRRLRQRARF